MADASVFTYDEKTFAVTQSMKDAYNDNGYVLIRNVLNDAEMTKLKAGLESPGIQKHAYNTSDGSRDTRMVLWFHCGDDMTGAVASCEKIAGTMEKLMGGDEVYHLSSKLLMKAPQTGGSFLWHQDYGYFYKWGYMYPNNASVFIAIDDCNLDNGCLQVLRGSHKMGRVDHIPVGKQLSADPERVEEAKKRLDLIAVDMKAGDVLYFNSNLLHCSGPNKSNSRRWSYVIAYNERSNLSYMTKGHLQYTPHPLYTPLVKVPNSKLITCDGVITDQKWFLKAEEDKARD
ncbi:uncharacterized protein LOC135212576 isoform X2 [Macrobrachium nipponense]|uniref:uncharacterized protein LOC135212576 isoform X2 n=1 Tax=Macrobrachium nipponense TaxID=159736 RepID=UPI0030C7F51C